MVSNLNDISTNWDKINNCKNDEEVLTHLYSTYKEPIENYIKRKTPSQHSEEVSDKAMDAMYKNVPNIRKEASSLKRSPKSFRRKIYTINNNKIVDHYRESKKKKVVYVPSEELTEVPCLEKKKDHSDLIEDIKQKLKQKKPGLIRVFEMVVDKKNNQEIALEIGIHRNTVRERKKLLFAWIRKHYNFPE